VTLTIDQDIGVVSVFDLQRIANQRIGCKRIAKVFIGFLESLASSLSVIKLKIVQEGP
jgi:hypothetical protein